MERDAVAYGAVRTAAAELKACEDQRLRAFGLDPATVVPLSPDRVLAALPSSVYYPAPAMRENAEGRAVVAIRFRPNGDATLCRVVQVTGNSSLDESSCAAGLRAKVESIKGAADRWALMSIRWVLPH